MAAAWQDGGASAGSIARGVKHNRQIDETSPAAIDLGNFILRKLGGSPCCASVALPKLIHPPRFNRYGVGETYGARIDSAIMNIPRTRQTLRSDNAATLFLSEPAAYDGGVLEIDTRFGVQEVKLAAGDPAVYPAGSLHRVTPVTRGERLASFFWIQSLVRDTDVRAALHGLDEAIQSLRRERRVTRPRRANAC